MDIDSRTDLIADLGHLCLGSRLKRLGERMQAGVSRHLTERGCAVQPAQLPVLWALGVEGPLTIGALGERLGISQPGVSRAVAALDAMGMVTIGRQARDGRLRTVAITETGRALMADLSADLFPAVRGAVAAICDATGADVLAVIARIEAQMDRQPLEDRIEQAKGRR